MEETIRDGRALQDHPSTIIITPNNVPKATSKHILHTSRDGSQHSFALKIFLLLLSMLLPLWSLQAGPKALISPLVPSSSSGMLWCLAPGMTLSFPSFKKI